MTETPPLLLCSPARPLEADAHTERERGSDT